jgi:hypothetical protein
MAGVRDESPEVGGLAGTGGVWLIKVIDMKNKLQN